MISSVYPRLRTSLQAVEKCHGDAMTSLSLASGSGDDGVLPEEVSGFDRE